jgi:ribosomal protein S18 acetylase RimI-like enzyme
MTTIRTAQIEDADAVVALWHATEDVLPTSTDSVESVRTLLARDARALLVAEHDGRIVGTLIVGWDGWRGSLYRMAVATEMRRRGIARELVAAAEAQLAGVGCVRISAWVDSNETHAAAFWKACGYDVRGAMDRFVKNT